MEIIDKRIKRMTNDVLVTLARYPSILRPGRESGIRRVP